MPKIVKVITEMQRNGNKGRDGVLVAGMGIVFDAVGKHAPHIQPNVTQTRVLATADSATNVAQIHGVCHNLGVRGGQLPVSTKRPDHI